MEKSWFAIYTRSRNEKKVFEALADSGIEVFLPLVKTLHQWSDRKKWVEVPLFRSYVFVHISQNEYLKVLNARGVVKFITFEGRAVVIPVSQIEAVKQYISESPQDEKELFDEFIPSDRVEIISGPMMGLQGRLIHKSGNYKVKIEIEAVSQSVYLSIPVSKLKKV